MVRTVKKDSAFSSDALNQSREMISEGKYGEALSFNIFIIPIYFETVTCRPRNTQSHLQLS
ncbi:MAG TPA: hypothetical protein ENH24_03285 [Nitrospirae bacterium]|nr:hypothetical protein [Nitrospirota bacterium]